MSSFNNKQKREYMRRLFHMKKTERIMAKNEGYRTDITMNVYISNGNANFFPADTRWVDNINNVDIDNFLTESNKKRFYRSRQEFSTAYLRLDQTTKKYKSILFIYPGKSGSGSIVINADLNFVNILLTGLNKREVTDSRGTKHEFTFDKVIIVAENGFYHGVKNYLQNQIPMFNTVLMVDKDFAYYRPYHALCPIEAKRIKREDIKSWQAKEGLKATTLPLMVNIDILGKFLLVDVGDVVDMEIMGTTTDTAGYSRLVRRAPIKK